MVFKWAWHVPILPLILLPSVTFGHVFSLPTSITSYLYQLFSKLHPTSIQNQNSKANFNTFNFLKVIQRLNTKRRRWVRSSHGVPKAKTPSNTATFLSSPATLHRSPSHRKMLPWCKARKLEYSEKPNPAELLPSCNPPPQGMNRLVLSVTRTSPTSPATMASQSQKLHSMEDA